jgi:hypothetical protein
MQKNLGFKGYGNRQASSYWFDDLDVSFKVANRVDHTKLAAAQRAIANFVNIVTGKQIPVVFQSNDSSYTDGEKVVIGTKLEDKNFDPAVGLALHEGSHIAFTDFTMFKGSTRLSSSPFANIIRMKGMDPEMDMAENDFGIIKDLLNWIEDRRIDYKVYTNAPGYRMYYEAMYDKYFNDKVIDKALVNGEKVDETMDCYLFHIINFTNVNRQLDALKELRSIWTLIDLKNIGRLKTTKDALDIACDVYLAIKNAVKENAPADGGASGQPAPGAGNGSSGTSMSGDIDDMDMELSDDEDDTDDNGSVSTLTPKEQKALEKAIEAQREFLSGDVAKKGRLTKSDSKIVEAIRESGTETRTVNTDQAGTGCPVTCVVIKKLTPAIIQSLPELFCSSAERVLNGTLLVNNDSYQTREIRNMDTAVNEGIVLGKKLGSKLQLRNSDRSLKTTRLTAGKIDRRLVAQLGYNNANVFHRIVTDRYKNYFIHISIDASGSMSGTKFHKAITSAVAVAQAASMTTGIRVQISLRGTGSIGNNTEKAVTIYGYDSAHDKMGKIKRYFRFLSTFGCTPEGIAFKSIEKDLLADAKGDELIFVNYSDGEPTGVTGTNHYYSGVQFTRNVIKKFRECNVNVLSYFIYEGTVWDSTKENFHTMYGLDAKFIDPKDMRDVAKTLNAKFLEMVK